MDVKLIIFDLDGVLLSSREIHYEALNRAIKAVAPHCIISREEHLARYDGLSTTKKLEMLTETKGLVKELHSTIWEFKQKYTRDILQKKIDTDFNLIEIFEKLRDSGYKIAVCSNSIRENTRLMLFYLGILHLVDHYFSNEDVKYPKPHGSMYTLAMYTCHVNPKNTIILEDSHIGREAALSSGAHLLPIREPSDVTLSLITDFIEKIEQNKPINIKWQGGKLNVLIPCAGLGSRFSSAGYTFPKPLIETIDNKPMIQLVVENLNVEARYIFLVQKEHYEKYNLKYMLNLIAPNCEIVQVDGLTEGAACTALLAQQFIDNDNPLLIANSDQYVEWNSNEFMYSMLSDNIDGGIATFTSTHPKWSYAKLGDNGFVSEVAEKKPISNIATVGIYYWSKGSNFVMCAKDMIKKNIRTNNEFYIAPVFNEAIKNGNKIKIFPVKEMHSLGVPEDLQLFLSTHK